ncbi:hypothetical protein [Prosthecobacter sp.]|uniref:hypothetical protein n=1 Tax=Prosthecobacter sp. TaxID=1965333 RepID=UPI003782D975
MLSFCMMSAFECLGEAAAPLAIPAALPLLQSSDSQVRVWACETLALWGNYKSDPAWQCAALAGASAAMREDDLAYLRYSLHLWSGHDPEMLLSVRWLGRPATVPVPAYGKAFSAAEHQAVLSVLLKLWPHSTPHPALRREIAQRTADVAQSITAAPEEKVAALLKSLEAQLKADAVKESQNDSAKAREAVGKALRAN